MGKVVERKTGKEEMVEMVEQDRKGEGEGMRNFVPTVVFKSRHLCSSYSVHVVCLTSYQLLDATLVSCELAICIYRRF